MKRKERLDKYTQTEGRSHFLAFDFSINNVFFDAMNNSYITKHAEPKGRAIMAAAARIS